MEPKIEVIFDHTSYSSSKEIDIRMMCTLSVSNIISEQEIHGNKIEEQHRIEIMRFHEFKLKMYAL